MLLLVFNFLNFLLDCFFWLVFEQSWNINRQGLSRPVYFPLTFARALLIWRSLIALEPHTCVSGGDSWGPNFWRSIFLVYGFILSRIYHNWRHGVSVKIASFTLPHCSEPTIRFIVNWATKVLWFPLWLKSVAKILVHNISRRFHIPKTLASKFRVDFFLNLIDKLFKKKWLYLNFALKYLPLNWFGLHHLTSYQLFPWWLWWILNLLQKLQSSWLWFSCKVCASLHSKTVKC